MMVHLVLDRLSADGGLEAVLESAGVDYETSHDLESAVTAARDGAADAVLVRSSEIDRFSRGETQISSYLRHQISNPLATVLGFAQLLLLTGGKEPDADRQRLEAIVESALEIRDHLRDPGTPDGDA